MTSLGLITMQRYQQYMIQPREFVFLWRFTLSFCGISLYLFVMFHFVFLWQHRYISDRH